MGESFFSKWLEEEEVDLVVALVHHGVRGILSEFECWLDRNGHLKDAP